MRKILIMLLLCCMTLLLAACQSAEPNDDSDTPNTDPDGAWLLEETDAGGFLGTYTESKYDQIVVTPISESFSLKTDKTFSCKITNNNVGHGFYILAELYIDKYADGQWVRLNNKEAEYLQHDPEWSFIGIENNTDEATSTQSWITVSSISPEVTPGRYRFVVFTPANAVYAEFDVTE